MLKGIAICIRYDGNHYFCNHFAIQPITTDKTQVEGFDDLDFPPDKIDVSFESGTKAETIVRSNDQLISMRISGQNDSNLGEDKKLKSYQR